MSTVAVDLDLIEDVAAQLDLRRPNRDALHSIAWAVSAHYDKHRKAPPFEGVVDVATGVGKTFVIAAGMEYFAALGHRHFAVITPGSTILHKTVRNFAPGDPKSLLGGMSFRPEIITAETFDSPMVAMQMDDTQSVKLYIFTVQSLTKPTTQQGRRAHEFRESLGEGFYEKLASEPDLIVFADEHHTYYGPAFSRAVRDLNPYALIGLTATPHPKTPKEQIIYRYPLAAAIADRYVKTPVIVGRRDDRGDDATKLADGARLLEMKAQAIEKYATEHSRPVVNPVMLVVAQSIEEANEYASLLESPNFFDGRFKGRVLTVHSDNSDAALADLEKIEMPQSPVRIVVSVGMLKEGWDVKNVYVIASMRASVSDILTEQTLGRGLRLPYGQYTGIEMLDTLEVVAHERYQDLLRRAEILKEEFVDYRTLIARDSSGTAKEVITEAVYPEVSISSTGIMTGEEPSHSSPNAPPADREARGGITISSVEARTEQVEQQLSNLGQSIEARAELPAVEFPVVQMTPVKAKFSLADVDPETFKELGSKHASDPEQLLLRTVVSAEVVGGDHRDVRLVTRSAKDDVEASAEVVPLKESLGRLRRMLSSAEEVPARPTEVKYLDNLVSAYVEGLGPKAKEILSAFPERAAAAFRKVLREEQRKLEAKPEFGEVIRRQVLCRNRAGRAETSKDLAGRFRRGVGYEGWKRSYFPQAWFDSSPEFQFARIIDDSGDVEFWVRLLRNDLPIMYTSGENHYNPDFFIKLISGDCILAEVKAEEALTSEQVQAKKDAARRWTRRASAELGAAWEYIIVTDEEIKACRGSWSALITAAR